MPLTIREAIIDDVDAIRSIGVRTWPLTYSFAGPDYIADGIRRWWSSEAVLRGIEDAITLVAVDDEEIVGMSLLDTTVRPAVIWKLYVLPERQGSGVGHALMEQSCERAARVSDAVRLEYTDGNTRAQGFYERHSFEEIEREPSSTPGWPDGVWMERRLN